MYGSLEKDRNIKQQQQQQKANAKKSMNDKLEVIK
jgi:hypothetical protein